jgi:hypothetical protein
MATIDTLASDIYHLLHDSTDFTPSEENLELMSKNLGTHLSGALSSRNSSRELGKLWFSELGESCERKMWYKFNSPSEGEDLPGAARFKFLYGDIIEEQVLLLAKEAGHSVTNEQHRVEYECPVTGWKVSGRIDAVVDGRLIDVKSCSSYAFSSYKYGISPDNDTFGYRYQLSGYHHFNDLDTSECGFLWVDKQNGFITHTPVEPVQKEALESRVAMFAKLIEQDEPPPRSLVAVPEGKSGNMKLDTKCSYCDFKFKCWPNLRVYRYARGPVFLTTVKKEPNVQESTHEYRIQVGIRETDS